MGTASPHRGRDGDDADPDWVDGDRGSEGSGLVVRAGDRLEAQVSSG